MASILLKFVNRNGRFCICATVRGTTTRHYRTVEELVNPDFRKWDKIAQCFVSRKESDQANNRILNFIIDYYERLMSEREFNNGKELFDYAAENNRPKPAAEKTKEPEKKSPRVKTSEEISLATTPKKRELTVGEWIEVIIEGFKNPSRLKPSAAYQGYLALFNKLRAEGNIIKMPISGVNDDTFVQLIAWLKKNPSKIGKKGVGFINTMKVFTSTMNRARRARLTGYKPDFPYMDYAPVYKVSDRASEIMANGGAINSLSPEQYESFISLDLDRVPLSGPRVAYYKELYRDFCELLYELKSRPIDILKLHWDNLALDKKTGRYVLTYIPTKKKNYGASSHHTSKALVIQYPSANAVRIMMKYQGKSKGGYVFPFSINDRRWNLDNPMDFHHYYYKSNHICGRINRFLHKVEGILEIPFSLTLYVFRRTAITHAIIDNQMPIMMLAKVAGTSVEMIEAHYANYLHALAAY